MIYLSKILPVFVLPAGVILFLMVAGVARRRRALVIAGTILLWICSTPVVGSALQRGLEAGLVRKEASSAPNADAIVVLSTGRVVAPGTGAVSEWTDPDRFFAGVELFTAGKAPMLIFTGGWAPWEPDAALEGDVLRQQAIAMGIPAERIRTTGRVVNTAEEAAAVSAMLRPGSAGPARIVLVTSAFHMPRATRLFERAGLSVTGFPVDFRSSRNSVVTAIDFLPSAAAFAQTEGALREFYGRWFYGIVAVGRR